MLYLPAVKLPSSLPYHSSNASLSIPIWLSWESSDLISISMTHRFTAHVLSIDPLMMYLDGFLHLRETEHPVKLGSDQSCYKPQPIFIFS